MASDAELDPNLLVRPLTPGLTIPESLDPRGLFLLNFGPVLRDDVWDDYGIKELDQAQRLRNLASLIQSMADDLDDLGHILKAYPDPNDLDEDVYEETWATAAAEMEDVFEKGYALMAEHVGKIEDAAVGDFMD